MHPNHRISLHIYAPLAALLGLVACAGPELPEVDPELPEVRDGGAEGAAVPLREPCIMSHVYLVEADKLTYFTGHESVVDSSWHGEQLNPRVVRLEDVLSGEPFYSVLLALHFRRGGRAELWWGEAPVVVTEIDRSYYTQKKTDIRAYESPSGERAELHVLSRAACFTPPAGPLTRSEVELLER